MHKGKMILLIIAALFVVITVFSFSACGNKGDEFVINGISAPDIVMDDVVVDLPGISLVDAAGGIKAAGADDFWFNARYVFVQDGKVKVKENAPAVFNDELEITYKYNTSIKTIIVVEKVYVALQSITLSTADGRNKCPVGGNIKINVDFIPQNVSNKYVVYEIKSGDAFADIDENGVLFVKNNAEIGTEITISVMPSESSVITAEIIITVGLPLVTRAITLLEWRDGGYGVQEWLFTSDYNDWQDINLDFRQLSMEGYEQVTFAWTISAANEENKKGTAEPEIKVELYNNLVTKTIYHNQDTGWGTDWEEHIIEFTLNINNILTFNQIRCAFKDKDEDEHYSVAWSAVMIIVS